MGTTSLHFSHTELACKHCNVNNCTRELVEVLEKIRLLLHKPVSVTSGYRCSFWNQKQGGANSSQHLLGNAADIQVTGMSAGDLERAARQIPEIHGIGRNDTLQFLHIDVRRHSACWCYDESGKDVAYYPPPNPEGTVNA